ncbi:Y26D4A.11 protein [Aphelenchoides avenae]|nr:Y26D4A.11 protein [Aphelenchus avenae]
MISAFERLFKRARVLPWRIVTDQGLEFTAAAVRRYFKEKDVLAHCTYTHPTVHAGVVERANRTIKERLYRYFSERNTTRWVDVVQQVVDAINRSVCRSTGVAPRDVTFANAASLRARLYGNEAGAIPKNRGTAPSLKVGDYVRIEKNKQVFEKGYLPRFTDELFVVTKVRLTPRPATFALRDESGEPVRGWFYANELCPVRKDANTVYRVERVLKSRKSKRGGVEHFVKWLNRPTIYNAWVHESDFV